jgi:hypothetical protein
MKAVFVGVVGKAAEPACGRHAVARYYQGKPVGAARLPYCAGRRADVARDLAVSAHGAARNGTDGGPDALLIGAAGRHQWQRENEIGVGEILRHLLRSQFGRGVKGILLGEVRRQVHKFAHTARFRADAHRAKRRGHNCTEDVATVLWGLHHASLLPRSWPCGKNFQHRRRRFGTLNV